MPTILRLNGYRFYFYSHEPNEPPHIHIDKCEATMKLWLHDMSVAKHRGFRAHEISAIIEMAKPNKALFLEAWNAYFG